MAVFALVISFCLMILGFGGYFAAEAAERSMTAFIPTAVGILIAIPALIALRGGAARKHGMHVVVVLALLGAIAPLGRLIPSLMKGETPGTLALTSLVTMLVLCSILLAGCIASFIAARQARESEGA